MDPLGLLVITLGALVLLLTLGYRGLRAGLNDEAAFGAVCLALATMLGSALIVVAYAALS